MSGEKLERYAEHDRDCVKCGATGNPRGGSHGSKYQLAKDRSGKTIEYILRTCVRCRYEWVEACLDADSDTRQRDGLG